MGSDDDCRRLTDMRWGGVEVGVRVYLICKNVNEATLDDDLLIAFLGATCAA